jgi:hypothetical protein
VYFSVLGKIVTVVKKAKLIAADGKLSLTPGIPIHLYDHAVSIRTAHAADIVLNPNEKSPPPSGNPFNMIFYLSYVFF